MNRSCDIFIWSLTGNRSFFRALVEENFTVLKSIKVKVRHIENQNATASRSSPPGFTTEPCLRPSEKVESLQHPQTLN